MIPQTHVMPAKCILLGK